MQVQTKSKPRKHIIKDISLKLRQMARNCGFEIDEIFRNENGISYQIQSMESAFIGYKKYVPATKMFTSIVDIYKTNPKEFESILKEAYKMIDTSDITEEFSVQLQLPSSDNTDSIFKVLMENYQYGFRYGSIREILRFRNLAESMGIDLPNSDDDLRALIISLGSIIDDKVFFKSENLADELNRVVSEIFLSGIEIIYYEMLFDKESELMKVHTIVSAEMLKEYLQKNIRNCYFSKKFMGIGNKQTEKKAVTDELIRVWGDAQIRSVLDLSKDLQYIPLSNIARVISGNDNFVFVSEGEYLWVQKLKISEYEKEIIYNHVELNCQNSGFASLSDIPLGDVVEVNYDVPFLTIINAVFKLVLSEQFQLNGRIVTKNNSNLDAVTLLKEYLSDKNECTFDEALDRIVEFTGTQNRNYAFKALYDEMIRIEENRFVSSQNVEFDIDEVDNVLSNFVIDGFCAIKDVTTFVMFPNCGYNWNFYLLESFCYRFSKMYDICVIHFNDKNSGMIVEKTFNKKYDELLALALARTDIELEESIAGQYLFDNGYLSKSKYSMLGEIIEEARRIREER